MLPPPAPTDSMSSIGSAMRVALEERHVALQRAAVVDDADVERRAAHVDRDDVLQAGRGAGDHDVAIVPGDRAGLHRADRRRGAPPRW